jgi:hypothetical protein|tara:strand:+ start:5772 stop:6050 length:279 start_codon:yes stop_codon:yes gene_type:complete
MEGNKMSTEEVEENMTKEGPRWTISARCATYEEANQKRQDLKKEDGSLQIKIHWQGGANNRYFAVKSRVDPEIQAMVAEMEKKSRKKGRTRG